MNAIPDLTEMDYDEWEENKQGPSIVIDGLDILDILHFITNKRDKFIAIALAELEEQVAPGTPEFRASRKIILDGFNDYTRSLLRILFGDVEGMVMK